MEFYRVIRLLLVGILWACLLPACGGGGGSEAPEQPESPAEPPEQPEPSSASQVFLGLAETDNFVSTINSGNESLSLFEYSNSQGEINQNIVFSNGESSIIFGQFQGAGDVDVIQIEGYFFQLVQQQAGALLMVDAPDGSSDEFYFDSDLQLISDDTPSTPDNPIDVSGGDTCVISARYSGENTSFCNSNYSNYLNPDNCSVAWLGENQNPNGDILFNSARYSTTQSCTQRGYPYLGGTDVWWASQQLADAMRGSMVTRYTSIAAKLIYTRSGASCSYLASVHSEQIQNCIAEQYSALPGRFPSASIFFAALGQVLDASYPSLAATFVDLQDFYTALPTLIAQTPEAVLASEQELLLDLEDDDNFERIKTFNNSLQQLFNDFRNGELAESYPELGDLGELINDDGHTLGELIEPTQPEEPTEPEEPVQPEEPTEPEEPVQPEEPTEPEEPVQPEEPTEPENTTRCELSVESDTSVTPITSTKTLSCTSTLNEYQTISRIEQFVYHGNYGAIPPSLDLRNPGWNWDEISLSITEKEMVAIEESPTHTTIKTVLDHRQSFKVKLDELSRSWQRFDLRREMDGNTNQETLYEQNSVRYQQNTTAEENGEHKNIIQVSSSFFRREPLRQAYPEGSGERCLYDRSQNLYKNRYTRSRTISSDNTNGFEWETVAEDTRDCPLSLLLNDYYIDWDSNNHPVAMNDLTIHDMWLKTGEYQQYIED